MTYAATVLRDNPIGYWPLRTNAQDQTRFARHGTVVGGAAPKADGSGYFFDGVDDYIEIADSDAFTVTKSGLTVEAWMRPDTTVMPRQESTGYVHWLGKGEAANYEWVLRMYQDGNTEGRANRISGYAFPLAGGSGIGSYFQDAIDLSAFIHVVLCIDYDGTNVTTRIYKNGIQRDVDSVGPQTQGNGTAPVRIGTRNLLSFFRGQIRELSIYSTVLTAAQVKSHYSAALAEARENPLLGRGTKIERQGSSPYNWSDPPELEHYRPRLMISGQEIDLGANPTQDGDYSFDGHRCKGELMIRIGTGGGFAGATGNWSVSLPMPMNLTLGNNLARFCGHGTVGIAPAAWPQAEYAPVGPFAYTAHFGVRCHGGRYEDLTDPWAMYLIGNEPQLVGAGLQHNSPNPFILTPSTTPGYYVAKTPIAETEWKDFHLFFDYPVLGTH